MKSLRAGVPTSEEHLEDQRMCAEDPDVSHRGGVITAFSFRSRGRLRSLGDCSGPSSLRADAVAACSGGVGGRCGVLGGVV